MPKSRKKQAETEPDLEYDGVSLRGFIAWLETKDPAEEYEYIYQDSCAVGQYKTHLGHKNPCVEFAELGPATGRGRNWLETIVIEHPRTFGGALKRARAIAARL